MRCVSKNAYSFIHLSFGHPATIHYIVINCFIVSFRMWNGYLMPTLNRSPWTAAEEDKLLNAAIQFDGQDWSSISKELEHRSAYQCFVHYHARFEKNVQKNVRWTQEQDHKLVECVEKFRIGNIIPWTKVMEHCTDRTKSQVYNRFDFHTISYPKTTSYCFQSYCRCY